MKERKEKKKKPKLGNLGRWEGEEVALLGLGSGVSKKGEREV